MNSNSVTKNFLYNVTYQLLLIILPLITTPYISRVLGSGGMGTYTYTYTIANYFMLAAMLGVKNYGNRSTAAVRDSRKLLSRTFWEIYGLQFLCSAVVLAVYLIYILAFVREYRLIALIQGIYVLSGLLDISWLFFGVEQFRITVTRNIVIRLINLGCIFLLVKDRGDLWIYTLIMTMGIALSQGYLWLYIRQIVDWYRPKLRDLRRHVLPELILFVPIIAVSLYTMMDKVMLGAMSTMNQVGFYEGASKILNIPLGVITALGTVMLPRMSNLAAKRKVRESGKYIYNSMIFAMFLASGMMFGIAGIAEDFVPLFLGEEYSSCVNLIRVMAPTVPFIAWANVIRTQYLIPNHEDRSYIISVVLGALVNLTVNALLIPHMQALGAVVGTVCAEGSVCISQTIMVRKKLKIVHYLRNTGMYFVFGAVMYLMIRAVHSLDIGTAVGLITEILAGGCVYVLLSGSYFLLTNREAVGRLRKKITRE